MRALLSRFRRSPRPVEPRPDDHVAAVASPPKADEGHRATLAPSKPPEASPAPATQPRPATVVRRPAAARIDLANVLGCQLKADQALWAPELLTEAERKKAARILRKDHP
jgi:hypothetical protein